MANVESGVLYVVATPIGNLADISQRARAVLSEVDVVAAEDTRHSGRLLAHLGIKRPMLALHEHNEERALEAVLTRLRNGESVALVSDAGTPLISDPGFKLVRAVRAAGLRAVPVPGASALIAALSVSGLPTDRFVFEGFLPAKQKGRRDRLQALSAETRTLIFYESSHRIQDTIADMASVFGSERQAVIARELTKLYEQIADGGLRELSEWLEASEDHCRGEFVVMVAGAEVSVQDTALSAEDCRIVDLLAAALPPKKAAAMAAEITGKKKKGFYDYLVNRSPPD